MRKTSYQDSEGQERFILPLLNDHIIHWIKYIPIIDKRIVLDIGCGNQPFKLFFTQEEWEYESMDIAQNDFYTVDYIGKIDEKLNIVKKYDLLLCTEVLEHVLHWEQAFTNFKYLVKNNGYLLLTVPFFYPLHEEPYDYWRPTHYAIEAFAKKYGFEIIKSKKAGNAWDLIGTLCHSIFMKPKTSSFKSKVLYMILYRVQKWLKLKLEKELIQNNIEIESKYYLSNVFLLKKVNIIGTN